MLNLLSIMIAIGTASISATKPAPDKSYFPQWLDITLALLNPIIILICLLSIIIGYKLIKNERLFSRAVLLKESIDQVIEILEKNKKEHEETKLEHNVLKNLVQGVENALTHRTAN
jgi:biopolymer transport protein ExbB/TolQ